MDNNKYVKVLFGNTGTGGMKYKIGKENIAETWRPNQIDPKKCGGFNFSTEDKIIRWLVRGDTLYDVTIPEDAEVIEVSSESDFNGVFRTNKIIITNPRLIDDEMAMELYKKSNLQEKSYFKAMAGCALRGYMNVAKKIFEDKVNEENINLAIDEFEDFCKDKGDKDSYFNKAKLGENCTEIYEMLENLRNISFENAMITLLNQCGYGEILEKPTRISGGFLNRLYKVKTIKGTYVIKALNPKVMKRKNAKNNHIFAENVSNIARNHGVKCLPARVIEKGALIQINSYYFMIFDWVEGNVIKEKEVNIEKIQKVAKELAKIHKIDFKTLKDQCKVSFNKKISDWTIYIEKLENENLKRMLDENKKKFEELDEKSIECLKKISRDMVISHRDLDLSNVIWNENDEPVIIDWESAGLINPIVEVIDTAWNWRGIKQNAKNNFKDFIETYNKENPGYKTDFKDAAQAVLKYKFDWLEYNLKRACGIECLDEEEKELGEKEAIKTIDEIKDYEKFIKKIKID